MAAEHSLYTDGVYHLEGREITVVTCSCGWRAECHSPRDERAARNQHKINVLWGEAGHDER